MGAAGRVPKGKPSRDRRQGSHNRFLWISRGYLLRVKVAGFGSRFARSGPERFRRDRIPAGGWLVKVYGCFCLPSSILPYDMFHRSTPSVSDRIRIRVYLILICSVPVPVSTNFSCSERIRIRVN